VKSSLIIKPDPKLDLVLERVVDVPRELVWKAWTEPEHLKPWFCPKPWSVSDCEIDLRPGGVFSTVMCSPEGENFPNIGCYLEVVPNERLIWTDALLPGFRPTNSGTAGCPIEGHFTAIISLKSEGAGTRYTAVVLHRDEAGRKQHEDMGFFDGWNTALDQLVDHVKKSLL
jgi:uncharacterized protein YndB with AHSA1/START domain